MNEKTFKNKIGQMDMENFRIPDSINTALIAASYYETDPEGYTLIVYDSEDKKSATKLTFLAGDSMITDSLVPMRFNEFRSKHYNLEYVIGRRTVCSVYKEKSCTNFASMSATKEYLRSDTNLAITKKVIQDQIKVE